MRLGYVSPKIHFRLLLLTRIYRIFHHLIYVDLRVERVIQIVKINFIEIMFKYTLSR